MCCTSNENYKYVVFVNATKQPIKASTHNDVYENWFMKLLYCKSIYPAEFNDKQIFQSRKWRINLSVCPCVFSDTP